MGKARRFYYGLFNLPVTCRSVVLAGLFDNLIRTGGRKAGNNAHGQGGQRISGGKVRHVDVHGGHPQQAAKGTTDGRQPFVGQWGLLNSRCGKVADNGDAGNGCDAKRCKISNLPYGRVGGNAQRGQYCFNV